MINGVAEPWTFGFMFETILTRDTWMHRIDTAQATGRPLVLTAEHDGVLAADLVASGPPGTAPPSPCASPGPPEVSGRRVRAARS